MIKILFIVTSHALLGATGHHTGVWLEELTTPYYHFQDAGFEVVISSVEGGEIPIDPGSKKAQGDNPETVERFLQDPAAQEHLKHAIALTDIENDGAEYDAVFFPGGHGTMWDLPENPVIIRFVSKLAQEGRVIAAVCHGPAGLIGLKNKDGSPFVQGKKVSAFTNEEEQAVGLQDVVPFALETRLASLGAEITKGPAFDPFSVVDGRLVTGQNPASSHLVAAHVIEILKNKNEEGREE